MPGGRGNFRGGRRGGNRGSNQRGNYAKDVDKDAEKNNPFYSQFKNHANFLDQRHDKRARLMKLSSDITMESKRIIFLLHRIKHKPMEETEDLDDSMIDTLSEEDQKILVEAEDRLRELEMDLWKQVASELADEDNFMYLRSYTGGLQEYVEALSFFHHLKFGEMISWDKVQSRLSFQGLPIVPTDEVSSENTEAIDETKVELGVEEKIKNIPLTSDVISTDLEDELKVMVPQADYMLGIADLTGEVMRQAINSAGAGNTKACFRLLTFLQEIHDGFVGLRRDYSHREISAKIRVLRGSLRKVENVCYNINVRGSEVPKHLVGTYLGKTGQLTDNKRSSDFQESANNDDNYDYDD